MPPADSGKKLTAAEAETLRDWIAQGEKIEDKEIIIKKFMAKLFTCLMARGPIFGDRETLENLYQTSAESGHNLRN